LDLWEFMVEDLPIHVIRAGLGFLAGGVLGFVARRGRFCTLGAIEDAVYAADTRRLATWALAVAVAMAGTHLLGYVSSFDVARAIYLAPRLEWAGAVLGGMLFGLGMALVGTCGFGSLLRLGGGDLKAAVTCLVMAVTAAMAMRGLTGLVRIRLIDPLAVDVAPHPSQAIPDLLGLTGGGRSAFVAAIVLALAFVASMSPGFWRSRSLVLTGIAIGATIVAGWWITGVLGQDPFDPRRVESFSFVAPVAETLTYAMFASGTRIDFPVGAVLGAVAGSFLAARVAGEFHWEAPDDAREFKRHLLGAFLMGTGGISALGCTIGQGVTGLSTLSVGSLLAIASIFVGARIGLYWLVEWQRPSIRRKTPLRTRRTAST
jgi:uncharacterized membrane protein YedE/YeeE